MESNVLRRGSSSLPSLGGTNQSDSESILSIAGEKSPSHSLPLIGYEGLSSPAIWEVRFEGLGFWVITNNRRQCHK